MSTDEEEALLTPCSPVHAGAEDDEGVGYADYQRSKSIISCFKLGSDHAYCTLSSRVSIHDSWELNADDEDGGRHGADGGEADEDTGDFVSFWGHGEEDSETKTESRRDEEDEERVETTLRPLPLSCRRAHGSGKIPYVVRDAWFQREPGLANRHFNDSSSEMGRRRSSSASSVEEFGDGACLAASPWGEGHGTPSPFPSRDRDRKKDTRRPGENLFGGNQRPGILAWPIIRPFLRGSRRGFTDDDVAQSSASMEDDDDGGDMQDCAGDVPSRRDREAVVNSISRGIVGTHDDSLLLDPAEDDGDHAVARPAPNLLKRMILTVFQLPDESRRERSSIGRLHQHFRKEDWALATTLLQSQPRLARTWFNVDRLYDGRYDGEALPLHAACALRPPPSLVALLATSYPEGLLEKDKRFGRVPLHVACRSLAASSVIRKLCELEPNAIEARDDLKRLPLHYLLKNYSAFGEDSDDASIDGDVLGADANGDVDGEEGMNALRILLHTSPACARAADHRGWLPLHVACSCSSRMGMVRVLRLLLKAWPESVHATTDKGSDPIACVDMAGTHHPTKEAVIALLREASGEATSNTAESSRTAEECQELAAEDGTSAQASPENSDEENT